MGNKNQYPWVRLYQQAQQLIRDGCAPSYSELAHHLGINRRTLLSGFKREFGLESAEDLKALPEMHPTSVQREEPMAPLRYQGISPKAVSDVLRERPLSLPELADRLDRGAGKVEKALTEMIADGYEFSRQDGQIGVVTYVPAPTLPTLYDQPKRRICFGLGSDIHIGSKHTQISALRKFIEVGVNEYQVENFLWCGDMTTGVGVYRGQSNDLYAHSAEDQLESLMHTMPEYAGVKHIMIGGNHDYSFMKQNGFNIVKTAADRRSDFVYAGFDQAEIPLISNPRGEVTASAVLWHPSGGVPYALSYRGQKMAAEVSRKELADTVMERKPGPTVRFIFWGHLHVSDIFPHGPIWVIGPGCFEGTNGYLLQKGLTPVIQGMIIEADITEIGMVSGVHIHPIAFIEAERDYKAGWVPELERASKKMEPVFSVYAS